MSKVVISHAEADLKVAMVVCRRLEELEIECWVASRDTPPGVDYIDAIRQAIDSATIVVVLLSRHSNSSAGLTDTIQIAADRNKRIVPVHLEAVEPDLTLSFCLKTNGIDVQKMDLNRAAEEIALAIYRVAGKEPVPVSLRAVAAASTAATAAVTGVASISAIVAAGIGFVGPIASVASFFNWCFGSPNTGSDKKNPVGGSSGTFERADNAPPILPPILPPNGASGNGSAGDGDSVDCAVFTPRDVYKGQAVFIQVFGYPAGKEREAKRKAIEFDEEASHRGVTALEVPIVKGQHLQFHLTLGNVKIENALRRLKWQGKTASVQYEVTIPANHPEGNLLGTVVISTDGVPCGRIGFKLTVVGNRSQAQPPAPEWVGTSARFRKAFVSYASKDREAVLHRVQMLRPPFSNIDAFQDILGLEPGDVWSDELYNQINECDLFLLFWSSNAKASEWVQREWKYALKRQGPDKKLPPTLLPVIIEGPPPVSPPEELNHLHFNDYLLYLTKK